MLQNSFTLLSVLLVALSVFIPLSRKLLWHIEKVELYLRVSTWWWIIAVILLAGFNLWSLYLLVASVICCCLYELARINQLVVSRLWLACTVLILAGQWCIACKYWQLLLLVITVLGAVIYLISRPIGERKKRQVFILASACSVLGLSAASVTLSRANDMDGVSSLLFMIFICQGNDVAQYCWGKALGKKQIAPQLSPNKTWAGFLGGVFTLSAVGFFLGPQLTLLSSAEAALAAGMICIFGFWGDLSVSALKRFYAIKDMGSLLAGHGGMGDRVDSLLMSIWAFYLYVQLVI